MSVQERIVAALERGDQAEWEQLIADAYDAAADFALANDHDVAPFLQMRGAIECLHGHLSAADRAEVFERARRRHFDEQAPRPVHLRAIGPYLRVRCRSQVHRVWRRGAGISRASFRS